MERNVARGRKMRSPTDDATISRYLEAIRREYKQSVNKFPVPFYSPGEAWFAIYEEVVKELLPEVQEAHTLYRQHRDGGKYPKLKRHQPMYKEAIQGATMLLRLCIDMELIDGTGDSSTKEVT